MELGMNGTRLNAPACQNVLEIVQMERYGITTSANVCAKTHQVAPTPENGTRIYVLVNVKLNPAQLESNGISQPADVSAKIYYHAAVLLSFGIQQHVHVTVEKHVSILRCWIEMPVLAFVLIVSLARQE